MAGLENILRDCISSIQSTKITERKKGIESLRDYLQQRDVVEIINTQSRSHAKSSLHWNSIFKSCHHALLLAADKLHKEDKLRTASENSVKMCSSLVFTVVSKAFSGGQYLDYNLVVDAALQVLDSTMYKKIIGNRYILILNDHILSSRKYCAIIKPDVWKDLYEVSLNLCQESLAICKNTEAISMLNLTVKYGCEYSFLISSMKKNIFGVMKKMVKNVITENDNFQLKVLILLVTVCQKLQKECRMAICKFGEENVDLVLKLYQKKVGISEKNKIIFEFLLIIVETHHPEGVDETSPAAYAYDWNLWKNGLRKINLIFIAEINGILKYDKYGIMGPNFLNLTVQVYKQIFHCSSTSLDVTVGRNFLDETSVDESSSKKMRVTKGFPDLIDRLNSFKIVEIGPWLCILEELTRKYPLLMNEIDYMLILKTLSTFLSTSKESSVTDQLCKCCISLINVRKNLNLEESDIQTETMLWESIWQTSLRTIGLNQSIQWSHSLIQRMIECMWKPALGNAVLKLYLSGVIHLSEHSLLTLYRLRRRFPFPDTLLEIPVWSSLLQWMFPSNVDDQKQIFLSYVDLYAHMLVLLCLKNDIKNDYIQIKSLDFDFNPKSSISNVEILMLSSYESDLFFRKKKIGKTNLINNRKTGSVVNEQALELLVNFLIETHILLIETCQLLKDDLQAFRYLNSFILLLLHVQKFQNHYDIELSERVREFLADLIQKNFNLTSKLFACEDKIKIFKFLIELAEFFKQLGVLPASVIDSVVKQFFPLLKNIFAVIENFESNNTGQDDIDVEMSIESDNSSVFSQEFLCLNDKMKIEACKVVVYYSYNYDHLNKHQYNILNKLLEIIADFRHDLSPSCLLHMAIIGIQTTLNLRTMDFNLLNKVTFVLRALCDPGEWYNIEESALIMLNLMQRAIQRIPEIDDKSVWKNFENLINGIEQETSNRGPRVITEVVNCIGILFEIEGFQKYDTRENVELVVNKLINYLNSVFHEIRMTGVRFVSCIFKSLDLSYRKKNNGGLLLKENVLESFKNVLYEIFFVENLQTEEEIDESINRPMAVLYALGCMISYSQLARREALFYLFYLTHEKRLNKELAFKILTLVKIELKIESEVHLVKDNSSYILWNWFEKYNGFENFPYQVICFRSLEEFFEEFLRDIVPLLLLFGKMDLIRNISARLNISSQETLERCFSEIMAIILRKIIESSPNPENKSYIDETQMHNTLENEIGGQGNFKDLMMSELPQVIVALLRNLRDPQFKIPENSILPTPAPLRSNESQLLEAINYLQSTSEQPQLPLIVFIIKCNYSDYIQKIFQQLYIDVVNGSTPEVKLESFQKYIFFCDLLLPNSDDLLEVRMAAFVARTIIFNLLHFISSDKNNQEVSLASLRFFGDFISSWLFSNKNKKDIETVFQENLSTIVDKLVHIAGSNNELGSEALNLLQNLLSEQNECLFEAIQKLESFPDSPKFSVLKTFYLQMQDTQTEDFTLMNDITRFLDVVKKFGSCRVESLKYLRKQLSGNKQELGEIISQLRFGKGFSEQCATSKPHELICSLLQLINSADEDIKYEAACCLGEIGLVDLHTLVLKPNCEDYSCEKTPENLITSVIIKILKDCVIEKDVNLIQSSCKALYATLASAEGYNESKELEKSEKMLLYPFLSPKMSNPSRLWAYFDPQKFNIQVDNAFVWFPSDTSFSEWIIKLVTSILDSFNESCFLNVLQPVCRIKASCAEELFKYLILLVMKSSMSEPKGVLNERINEFFRNHFNSSVEVISDSYSSSNSSKESKMDIFLSKSAVQCLLDVVHFVRMKQDLPQSNDLNLNYLHVAKAAQYCSLHFSSVLYLELWINYQIENNNIDNNGNVLSVLELIGNNSAEEKNEFLIILREAFSKIGDSDALYGCGSSLILQPETRVLHYMQTENWTRVMESCDILLNSGARVYSNINDLSTAVGLAGFNYLQNCYLSSLPNLNSQLKNQFYESGWKLHKWDLPEPDDDEKTYAYHQYAALKDLQQTNFDGVRLNIENARRLLIPSLARVGLESTKNIYQVLSNLQCLQDIDDYLKSSDLNEILDIWRHQDEFGARINFRYKETIFNQRIRIIDLKNETAADFVLNIVKNARKENNFNYAESCLSFIKKKAFVSRYFEMKVALEEAKILWCRKETHSARYLLKNLLNSSDEGMKSFHSKMLRIYGSWLSEINLENADTIFDDYFLPSTAKLDNKIDENEKEKKSRLKTFRCVSEFADSQYQQISKYIKSDDFQRQQESIKEAKIQAEALGTSESADVRKTKQQLANLSRIDNSHVNEIKNKETRYLVLAVQYYLKLLSECEFEDLSMFRLISLWLENKTHYELHLLLKNNLLNVPSYKFILVLPQLIAHLTRNTADCFGYSLNKIIENCATDHPHHTLPLILSLANYVTDEKHNPIGGKSAKEERVLAACEYMKKFKRHEKTGEIAEQMEKLSDAYIEFAYHSFGRNVGFGETFNMTSKFLISKLKNIDKALCPTITLPVNKNAKYEKIIGIQRIDAKYMTVGGINAPKRINCLCTDGKIRFQLVKGRDDIRQDAVMQQVFTIMNKLLSENKHTSKRKLLIRTYKVIPLSQRSGILEWCSNTMSFGDYLTYKGDKHPGAHKRYRPQDILTHNARQRMLNVANKSDEEKLKIYKEICQKIKPVFRYFFLEKFPSPTMWFERKLAYIHSMAVTSIVGYVIGLGDRHVQNMLIDEETAEVIHIDFGVAFDQGLLLTFPERIPFRLTRDIEDGMGIFAIDGIFRRCCEQTLAVLRQNKNIIQTTIEVFLYDPLYQWTVTPEKKASIQSSSCKNTKIQKSVTEVNVAAPRALAGVMSKLQGLDEGTYTTIEGQVNRLIQQAKDPHNLSRLYSGWQPYL